MTPQFIKLLSPLQGFPRSVLAARLGRAVYHLLRKREAFDEERFWSGGGRRQTTCSCSLSAAEVDHAGD